MELRVVRGANKLGILPISLCIHIGLPMKLHAAVSRSTQALPSWFRAQPIRTLISVGQWLRSRPYDSGQLPDLERDICYDASRLASAG
eukprot:scaffold1885_cov402-Prasinococcus_capsulatus_cf.AAC.22